MWKVEVGHVALVSHLYQHWYLRTLMMLGDKGGHYRGAFVLTGDAARPGVRAATTALDGLDTGWACLACSFLCTLPCT